MATEEVTGEVSVVNTLLFQMQKGLLALPDIAVAEIVEFSTATREDDNQAAWYIGKMSWRNTLVPLISFDQISGDDVDLSDYNKVVVVNSVYQRDKHYYWAFLINKAPKMQHINAETLTTIEDDELNDVIQLQAELMGENIVFPNLEKLEADIVAQEIS